MTYELVKTYQEHNTELDGMKVRTGRLSKAYGDERTYGIEIENVRVCGQWIIDNKPVNKKKLLL